jgi:hypothetical protein
MIQDPNSTKTRQKAKREYPEIRSRSRPYSRLPQPCIFNNAAFSKEPIGVSPVEKSETFIHALVFAPLKLCPALRALRILNFLQRPRSLGNCQPKFSIRNPQIKKKGGQKSKTTQSRVRHSFTYQQEYPLPKVKSKPHSG